MGLLRLIRESMSRENSTLEPEHALIDAVDAWHSLRQGKKMKNSRYLQRFKSVAQAYQHAEGIIG
eukprot:CAMPEP_0168818854 /NCGR_PEP_ID=MMETSP0726-20121227/7975_1 /TAXON_ID=265536 /ORGANISM="Amphiprora sp., Strain CCMP467" /LENGTH=64 /DNA_ID=CAMNT_0008871201 /DNA_START=278 /DNA_END=472 /DNA_ORIENTATION=-